jgi:pimeloyl-ACP methyl ester carboxylesterase
MRKPIKTVIVAIVVLLLLILVVPFLIPIPPLEDVVPVQELGDPDSNFVEIDGVDFHYKVEGDEGKSALVLLHGFGASVYSWREVMPILGENKRVYAYDRPAFGLTKRPLIWEELNPYSRTASLIQLNQLLDHWGESRVVLVGHSAGGGVAMEFALAYPEKVKALILISPAVGSGQRNSSWMTWLFKFPQVQRFGPLLVRRISESGLEIIEQAWHDPSKKPTDTIPLYTKPLQAENWDVGLWFYSTTGETSDLGERLDEFSLPILVITGDDDRIVPIDRTIEVAGHLPGSELVILPECGHVPQEECPKAFMDAVTNFLDHLEP